MEQVKKLYYRAGNSVVSLDVIKETKTRYRYDNWPEDYILKTHVGKKYGYYTTPDPVVKEITESLDHTISNYRQTIRALLKQKRELKILYGIGE